MDSKGKQNLTPTSQNIGAKQEAKSQGHGIGDKITEAALKPKPGQQNLPPNSATKESTLEEGSLLSMVSTFAVDLTVAANEKVIRSMKLLSKDDLARVSGWIWRDVGSSPIWNSDFFYYYYCSIITIVIIVITIIKKCKFFIVIINKKFFNLL